MRKVLVAIVVVIVLVWLISYHPQPDGQVQVSPPIAPILMSPVISSTEQADVGRDSGRTYVAPEAAPDVAPESAPDVAAPPAPKPHPPATTVAMALRMWSEHGNDGPVSSHFQQRENAFVAESLDPLWSRSREAEILGQIAQVGGLRLINIEVECRTSMCRLQWTQDVPLPVEGELRGMPDSVYQGLLTKLGYTEMIPLGTAADARTITSLTYLPRPQD